MWLLVMVLWFELVCGRDGCRVGQQVFFFSLELPHWGFTDQLSHFIVPGELLSIENIVSGEYSMAGKNCGFNCFAEITDFSRA